MVETVRTPAPAEGVEVTARDEAPPASRPGDDDSAGKGGGAGRRHGGGHTAGARSRPAGEHRLGWYLAGPALAVMVAVTAYPLGRAVWLSLHR